MTRAFNFSAGPAVLPEAVLRQAADEMLDWHGSGMSVMEMSHRGKEFMSIAETAEQDLRDLLSVPANYKILFMQGGAIACNALIPLNLLGDKHEADFVVTGSWSVKSFKEAKKYCDKQHDKKFFIVLCDGKEAESHLKEMNDELVNYPNIFAGNCEQVIAFVEKSIVN